MATRVTQKAKEAMKNKIKEEQQTKKARSPRKTPVKEQLPEIIINDDYKVKVTKYSYDLYRKYDKNLAEEEVLDGEDNEVGWSCLGHFNTNNWDRIRKEIFDDMVLRKLIKVKEIDLEHFSVLVEKISKEIQKLFTSNNDVLLNKNKK